MKRLSLRKSLHKSFSVYYFERATNQLKKEIIPAEKIIKWLYNSPVGNVALESVVKHRPLTSLYGKYMDSKKSAVKIQSFIDLLNIDMTDYETQADAYKTFNEFFTRKLRQGARVISDNPFAVTSPTDGKLIAFDNITKNYQFLIKGYSFSIAEFLSNNKLAESYTNGSMFIVRLTPADYHWFHFPVAGIPSQSVRIKGRYYSVSPLSIHKKTKTFRKNKREYTTIKTNNCGDVIMAEIGATFVGCVKQIYNPFLPQEKGAPKGYFKFGGSSIILLFKENAITIDPDLLRNSKLSYETEIKMGERVALINQDSEE